MFIYVCDSSMVRTSVSGTWNVMLLIQKSWVQTPVRSSLGCIAFLPKLDLNWGGVKISDNRFTDKSLLDHEGWGDARQTNELDLYLHRSLTFGQCFPVNHKNNLNLFV